MILGTVQDQLNEAEECYQKIADLVRKGQPERIEIKNIRLQSQRLKQMVEHPEAQYMEEYQKMKIYALKYEQMVIEFDYAKTSKISKGDFLGKLRRIFDIREGDNSTSQIKTLDSRPPQQLSNSQNSSSSAGGVGKIRQTNSKISKQNMYRVPSVGGNSSVIHTDNGNLIRNDSISSNNIINHKNSYESKIGITSVPPKLTNTIPINDKINTELSQIKMIPNYEPNSVMNNGLVQVQPIASVETIEPIKDAIDKMISRDDIQTPISGLNELKQFPKPQDYDQRFLQGGSQSENQNYPQGIKQHISQNYYQQNSSYVPGLGASYYPQGVNPQIQQIHQSKPQNDLSNPQAFATYQQQDIYKQNIDNLFKKAQVIRHQSSFQSQMRSPSQRSRSKSKSKSRIRSTQRIRDLSSKQQLISKLAEENFQLRKQLQQNNGKIADSEIKKGTYPEGTLQFQKYIISNSMLKQENQQILLKMKQLETILKSTSKQNYHQYLSRSEQIQHPIAHKNSQKIEYIYHKNEKYESPTNPQLKTLSEKNLTRKIVPNHPLIELPPELGILYDPFTLNQNLNLDYEQRQNHHSKDYQNVKLNKIQRSQQQYPKYLQQQSQPPSMLPQSIRSNLKHFKQSPNFIDDQQFYKHNRSEFENNPSLFQKQQQQNIKNKSHHEISSEKYYTANNVSASGDVQRLQAQANIRKQDKSYEQRNIINQNNTHNVDSSGRQYQDFPKISNESNNSHSPIINGQSIEKSFDTFKVNPQSKLNSRRQNPNHVLVNQIQQPMNFLTKNRSSLLRNKVAFYKKSLVLIKDDPNFQLAFKRSQINRELNTVRLIFYVNNKQNHPQAVSFKYEYDQKLYTIKRGDILTNVQELSQGRQQLVIKLNDDLDADTQFIVCHLSVGVTSVDIIIPIFFFKFQSGISAPSEMLSYIIFNDQQFSPQFLCTLLPLHHTNPQQYLQFMKGEKPYKGQCSMHTSQTQTNLGFEWTLDTLKIIAPAKWINLISWTLSSDI